MLLKIVLLGLSLALVASQAVPPYPWNWDIFGSHDDNDGVLGSSGDHDANWEDRSSLDDPYGLGGQRNGDGFDHKDVSRNNVEGDRRKRHRIEDEVTTPPYEGTLLPGEGARYEKRHIDIYIGDDDGHNGDDGGDRVDDKDDAKDTAEGREGKLRENDPVGVKVPPSRRKRQSVPVEATPCQEPVVDDGEEPPISTEGDGTFDARTKRQDDHELPDPEPERGLPEVVDDALEAVLGHHEGGDRKKRDTDKAAAANRPANPCARKDCPENFDCIVRRVCQRPNQCRLIARCVRDRSTGRDND